MQDLIAVNKAANSSSLCHNTTGRVIISYLNTTEMLADCLTKALSGKQFEKLRYGMGIRELF